MDVNQSEQEREREKEESDMGSADECSDALELVCALDRAFNSYR